MAPPRRTVSAFLVLVLCSLALPFSVNAQCSIPPLQLVWANTTVTSDGLGVSRGFELGVGRPHQIFAFRPATTLNNTRINNVRNCGSASNNSCVGGLGGAFDPSKSTAYAVSIKSQWNGSQIDQEDSTGAFAYFNDDVGFQSHGDVNGFPLVMDSEEWGGAQSGLPLGTNSSFLRAAVAGRVAPSQVFGLWSGSRGIDPKDGLLIVGGYDSARVNSSSNFTSFPVGQWSLEKACPLQITITNLTYSGIGLMPANTPGIVTCIEPSVQRNVFPPSVATTFAVVTGQNATLYPKGMQYNVSSRPSGDLTITLSNGYQTTITNQELFTPLRGSDKNGRYAITNDSIVEAGVADNRKSNPGDVIPQIGGLFLTFNYLVVDYAKGEFRLAPAVAAEAKDISPNPMTICTPSNSSARPPDPHANKSGNGKNVGAIAGGTVGGVVGAAILLGLGFWFWRRHRGARTAATQPEPPAPVTRQMSELTAEPAPVRYEMPASRNSIRKSGIHDPGWPG